ncbi:F17a-G fimbrial adhesin precursor [compost metagenome]
MGLLASWMQKKKVPTKRIIINIIQVLAVCGAWGTLAFCVFQIQSVTAITYLGPADGQINISMPEQNGEPYLVANAGLTSSNTCHPSNPNVKDTEGKVSSLAMLTPHSVMFNGKPHTLISSGNPYFGAIVPTRDISAPDSDAVAITASPPAMWYPTPNASRPSGTDAVDARFRYVLYALPGFIPAGTYVIPQVENFLRIECKDNEGLLYQEAVGQRAVTVNVSARGCDVSSPASSYIDFGELSSGDFPNVGDTSSTRSMTINLQCDPNVALNVTLSDQSAPSNRTDTVSLSASSTAQGLGVHVVNPGTDVPYRLGPDDAGDHDVNQYSLGSSGPSGGAFGQAND